MEKSKLITDKLKELVQLAEMEGEPNVQIILYVILGARCSGDDGMLATKTQEYLRDVLIPKVEEEREISFASKN